MKYLILTSEEAAEARSALAWEALSPPSGGVTSALWSVVPSAIDAQAAMAIPDTPAECGVGIGQAAYDDLLSAGERAALLDELPEGWAPNSGL